MKFLSDYFNSGTAAQQGKKRFAAVLVGVTALLLAIALIVLMVASIATAVLRGKQTEEPSGDEGDTGNKIPNGYTTTTADPAWLNSGDLLFIDGAHPYTGTPEVAAFAASRPVDESGNKLYSMLDIINFKLTANASAALNAMVTDFWEETGDTNLWVTKAHDASSPYHALGTAVTLAYSSGEQGAEKLSVYNVDTYKWLYKNAHKYGFVMASENEGEENIFRYIGIPHASYMNANTKTFSEYLTLLQTKTTASKPLSIQIKGADGNTVIHKMYYIAPGTEVIVPEKNAYTVSGDNMGGYIITVGAKTAAN